MQAKFLLRFLDCRSYDKGEWKTVNGERSWVVNGETGYRVKFGDYDMQTGDFDVVEYTTDTPAPDGFHFMDLVEATLDIKPKDREGKQRTSFVCYGKVIKQAKFEF